MFRWICVSPLQYKSTEHEWSSIQQHINGLWQPNLTMDIDELHSYISDTSKSHVSSASLEKVAMAFASSVKEYTIGFNWQFFLNNVAISGDLFLILLILFPVFISLIHFTISSLTTDICTLQLKQKGEDARDDKA